ncbi:MAG: hypothetical protein C5B43_01475 [Verrucomicrobia bacterium]|nr:MAG: hypothetical protein C5B43_01475 [Verrucomicrobiota bacterium]
MKRIGQTPKSSQTQTQQPSQLEKKVAKELFANKSMEWVKYGKDSWITFVRAAYSRKDMTWSEFFNFVFNVVDFDKIKTNVLALFSGMEQHALKYSNTLAQNLESQIATANDLSQKKKILEISIREALNKLKFSLGTECALRGIQELMPYITSNEVFITQTKNAISFIKMGSPKEDDKI